MRGTTRQGVLILCAAAVGVLAIILDASPLFFLSAFLLMAPLSSRLMGILFLRGLSVEALPPLPVRAGEVLEAQMQVTNPDGFPRFHLNVRAELPPGLAPGALWGLDRPVTHLRSLVDQASLAGGGAPLHDTPPHLVEPGEGFEASVLSPGSAAAAVPYIAPHASGAAVCRIQSFTRGLFTIGPILLEHMDPLGFSVVRRQTPAMVEVTVLPRPLGVELAALVGGDLAGSESAARQRGSLDGSDFYGLRSYRPGDERRRIHWPTSARMGELMVVEREDLASLSLLIVLDLKSEAGNDDSPLEVLIRLAAQLMEEAIRGNRRLDLAWLGKNGGLTLALSRCANLDEALECLARINPEDPLQTAPTEELISTLRQSPSVALLTDRRDERVRNVDRVCAQAGWPGALIQIRMAGSDPKPMSGNAPSGREGSGHFHGWVLHRRGEEYQIEPLTRF